MRWPLLVAFALLAFAGAPSAAATTFEAGFSSEPRTGLRVELTVRVPDARDLGEVRLEVPAWIEVDGDPVRTAEAAEAGVLRWNVTPTRDGFWHAGLSRRGEPLEGCCVHVWSTRDRALFAPRADGAIPGELAVGFHPTLRTLDAERGELALRLTPQDRRFHGQTFAVESPLGDERERAPIAGPWNVTRPFALGEGKRAELSAAAYVEVAFEAGEVSGPVQPGQHRFGCARFFVERIAGEVREVSRAGCGTVPSPPPPAGAARPVPGAGGVAALAALLVGCCAAKAIRPPRAGRRA